jgi:hypothetical protein
MVEEARLEELDPGLAPVTAAGSWSTSAAGELGRTALDLRRLEVSGRL